MIDVYREEQREVHATLEGLQAAGLQVNAGLRALGDGELQQEGEDGQQVCVCIIERELHEQSPRPGKTTHAEINTSVCTSISFQGVCTIFHINANLSVYRSQQ